MEKRGLVNTARDEVRESWLFGGAPSRIEAQEAAGQKQLVASEFLPKEMHGDTREILEASGVVFGAKKEGDPLFVHATLPAGWAKRPTDHSMHSDLVDETGAVRARIFYKAAFYDRKAHMGKA